MLRVFNNVRLINRSILTTQIPSISYLKHNYSNDSDSVKINDKRTFKFKDNDKKDQKNNKNDIDDMEDLKSKQKKEENNDLKTDKNEEKNNLKSVLKNDKNDKLNSYVSKVQKGTIISSYQKSSLFETLSSIRSHGVNIDYSQIVSIGNQSSGKTSLTEAMCGIDGLFDKKTGMATKRPHIITLIKNNDGDADYIKIGNLEKIYNIERARERLKEENDGDISDKPLEIVICSSNIFKDCTFVDLPGFITATKSEEDSALPKRIREICLPYIKDNSNVKVVVMSATEDPALSHALKLVKKHDQMGNSIGVFTKIDMITNDRLFNRPVLDLMTDRSYVPHLGVVGVKLRSQADIAANLSIQDMLENEEKFIEQYDLKNKPLNFGVPRLMEIVSNEQVKRIAHTFPKMKEKITQLLESKRQNAGVLKRLIESDDITEISRELERIITDLHKLSPMRVALEQSSLITIRHFVKNYILSRYEIHPNHLITIDHKTVSDAIGKFDLTGLRLTARSNSLSLKEFEKNAVFGDYLLLGECAAEITIPQLKQTIRDNLSKSIINGFVQIVHPTMAPASSDTTSKLTWNRVQFTRDLQQIVTHLSSPEFTRESISIMINALKRFILKQGPVSDNLTSKNRESDVFNIKKYDNNDMKNEPVQIDITNQSVAELFFIHIFDLIYSQSNINNLNESIIRLIKRENRPCAEYDDITFNAYKRHLNRVSNDIPAVEYQSFFGFGEDKYPLSLHMYSPQMFEAYVDIMINRLGNDLFRMIAVDLLDPIIIKTIETCLKTFKQKDFSKQEKIINDMISTLEKQLKTIDDISKN